MRGNMPSYSRGYVEQNGHFYPVIDYLDQFNEPIPEPIDAEVLQVDMGGGKTAYANACHGILVTIH